MVTIKKIITEYKVKVMKVHLDTTTTTRKCPNSACDLGKLQILVTKETIVKPQNAQI